MGSCRILSLTNTKEKGRRYEIIRCLIPTLDNMGLHSRTKGERFIIDIMNLKRF